MDRNLIIISVGRLIQIIIALISVRVFTTVLSATEVGNIYLINSIVAFFGLALINPVGMFVNRKLHNWAEEKNILNNFYVYNIYLLLLSGASIAIVFALNRIFKIGHGVDLKLLITFVMLNIYFNTWHQTIIPSLNMLNHRLSFVIFTVLTLGLGLTFSVILVIYVRPVAVFWLAGTLFAQIIVTIFAFVYFVRVTQSKLDIRKIRHAVSRQKLRYVAAFTLPLGVTTLFMWMQNQSYRIIIENILGLEFLGMVGLGIAIASNIASAVESVAQQLYYPYYYREINTYDTAKREAAWYKMAQLTIPLYMALTLLITCLAPYLVNILADKKFSHVSMYVVFGAWIEFFRMTTNILSTIAHSEMQTRYLLKSYSVGGLLCVVGVYLGTKHHLYHVIIPIVIVMCGAVTMLLMYHDMKKLMRFQLPIRHVKQSLLLSIPFVIAFTLYDQPKKVYVSIIITLFFSIYFMITQYITAKPMMGKGTSSE